MTDEQIIDLLACGCTTEDVASALVDADVARGEYAGCSTELELAYPEHKRRAERVLAAVGG